MTDDFQAASTASSDFGASGPSIDDRVPFFERAGVREDVAESILADAERQVAASEAGGELKSVRIVPSTRVEVEGGFQVLAATTVQLDKRSVVSVKEDEGSQTLDELIIRNL